MSEDAKKALALSELPVDELIHYGQRLGLRLDAKIDQAELLRRVRARQELLLELDRDALLDVVVWARRPVRRSASKEELAKEIATVKKVDLRGLSRRGAVALARLRGLPATSDQPIEVIEETLRHSESLADYLTRKRRQVMGAVIGKVVGEPQKEDYQFLPEDGAGRSLREQISDEGVVGGIARRIRGVADDYVHEKLDEIEARIDLKLDEIDRRLAEWRDRELANRLKIIKITLVASVLVALLSLGYSYIKH